MTDRNKKDRQEIYQTEANNPRCLLSVSVIRVSQDNPTVYLMIASFRRARGSRVDVPRFSWSPCLSGRWQHRAPSPCDVLQWRACAVCTWDINLVWKLGRTENNIVNLSLKFSNVIVSRFVTEWHGEYRDKTTNPDLTPLLEQISKKASHYRLRGKNAPAVTNICFWGQQIATALPIVGHMSAKSTKFFI